MRILLHRSGLPPNAFDDPYAPIPLPAYLELFELAAEMAGDPIFGARIGFGTRPGNLAPIGLRAVQAGTIRRGLEAMTRYTSALQTGTVVTLEEEGGTLVLSYQITAPVRNPGRHDAEFTLAGICRLIRLAFDSRWRPLEVHFRHPPPPDRGRLDQMFGAPVMFGQSSNRILFSALDADQPHRIEDPDMIAMIERHLSDLIGEAHRAVTITEQAEALIAMYLGVKPISLETIGAALQLSPRTLQRRLADEGQNLSTMLQTHRRRRAEILLRERGMGVEAVAVALGYADGTAFWRAYQGWTGRNPSDVRRRKPPQPNRSHPA